MPNLIEELMYRVPESPDYNNLDQRLRELEGRTISDIDLDEMTKPASKEEAPEPMAPMQPAEPMAPMQPGQQPQGIGAMKEPDMSSMIPPEVSAALGNGIKNAVMQDAALDQETKQQIMFLSDNNLGEFVGKMLEKAAEIPDEEVSSMSMEKEEEAEGIIDRLMGNEQGMGMLDIEITPNSATYREEGFDLPTVEVYGEEMGWRERLNQLGSPEDINFAPTGLNWGGPVQNVPFDPNLGQPPRGTPMPPDLYGVGTPMPPMPPQQTPRQAQMQASLRAAAPRGGGRGWNHGGQVKQYNLGGIASMGRGGDSQLAHVMPGERMVPPGVVDDGMLDAAFVRAGLDPMEYKVGSSQTAVNPMTGMPEYGLFSFIKRLIKKVKKVAPVIGSMVGFAYGGPMGAGIGKAIGGVLKTGDLDFKDALMDFGTGWAMGNFATGMGMKGGVAKGQGLPGMKTIFQGADKGGIWGWGATPTIQHTIEPGDTVASIAEEYGITEQDLSSANPGVITPSLPSISVGQGITGAAPAHVQALAGPKGLPGVGTILNVPKLDTSVGGFIQQAGAKIAGGLGGGPMPTDPATGKPYEFGLMEKFKGLSAGQKLGVGALGLAALSKTGMFDEEELGDVPPEIQSEIEGLRAYANQPLKPAIQGQWGAGAPTISTPTIPSHTSFYVPPSKSSSLAEALAELNQTNLRLPSPTFT